MRILSMSLYTDRVRVRHGAPTPHAIITWERSADGARCTPHIKVTDLNGDDASHPADIGDVMAGGPGMRALQDVALYLLDMLRDVPGACPPDYDPSDEELDRDRERKEDYRAREERNLAGGRW